MGERVRQGSRCLDLSLGEGQDWFSIVDCYLPLSQFFRLDHFPSTRRALALPDHQRQGRGRDVVAWAVAYVRVRVGVGVKVRIG